MSDLLTRRSSSWPFVRRAPAESSGLDARGIIRHSTRVKIADDRIGCRVAWAAHKLNEELERFWQGLADRGAALHHRLYDEARRRARSLGDDVLDGRQERAPGCLRR